MKWDNHYVEDCGHLHVLPSEDSIPHCPANSCMCDPILEIIPRPDNSVGVVYLHRVLRLEDESGNNCT